jgi:uncharacterized protein (TIGR01777 family)
VAEHRDYIDGRQFRDIQIEGPFRRWEHTHLVEPDGAAACYLEDRIHYALPLGGAGALVGGPLVRRRLERMFAYRHRTTAQDVLTHAAHRTPRSMNVLVTGATGLVGSALASFLTTGGHRSVPLTRGALPASGAARWEPATGVITGEAAAGADAVVHLAGESVMAGRWTAARKTRIRESRVAATRTLAETLARLPHPPRVLVCASAIGVYGDRRDEVLDEASAPGEGFLAEVCRAWEAATAPATERGIRVVHLRIGLVLSGAGGALPRLVTPFMLGLGGRVGSGDQWMSWITIDDLLGVILCALTDESLRGPVNAVSPHPVTNAVFTRTLARVLSRPAPLPLPSRAARLLFGEMADALLLASARVLPGRLQQVGHVFGAPDLEGALRHVLGRTRYRQTPREH